jgi:hypothetical protein
VRRTNFKGDICAVRERRAEKTGRYLQAAFKDQRKQRVEVPYDPPKRALRLTRVSLALKRRAAPKKEGPLR